MGNACNSKNSDGLSNEDLEFITNRTNYDVATVKNWYKDFKQECPTGRLNKDTFSSGYKMFFPENESREFCDQVFRTFDKDGNGVIDFREFMLAIDVFTEGSAESKLKWAFNIYDMDMNGKIEMHEMVNIVSAIYDMLGVPKEEAQKNADNIFRQVDGNKDGVITIDEFMSSCLAENQLYQMLAPGGVKTRVSKIPSNFLV